ncbi:hypothetical protein RB195_024329 [Necator americanus]
MMYGSETWVAPSTMTERLDCMEKKLIKRLFGYFWPRRKSTKSKSKTEFARMIAQEAHTSFHCGIAHTMANIGETPAEVEIDPNMVWMLQDE